MDKFVAMDIDGVLADFEGFLVNYLDSIFPNLNHNRELYGLGERYPVKEVRDCAIRFVEDPNAYYAVPGIDGGFQFLGELLIEDIDVLLLTSRPYAATSFTKRWVAREMRELGMSYNDLLGVNFASNKTAYLMKNIEYVEFLIDDNPEEVLEAQKLGLTAYSWAQPWNEHVYPKVFATRDGYTMFQENEHTDPVYFWGKER